MAIFDLKLQILFSGWGFVPKPPCWILKTFSLPSPLLLEKSWLRYWKWDQLNSVFQDYIKLRDVSDSQSSTESKII